VHLGDWKQKYENSLELKEVAQRVVTITTIPDGYNSGNKYPSAFVFDQVFIRCTLHCRMGRCCRIGIVVVSFYYIHPKAHKVGQPLGDSLVVAARYHSSRFLLYPPEGA